MLVQKSFKTCSLIHRVHDYFPVGALCIKRDKSSSQTLEQSFREVGLGLGGGVTT